MGLCGWPGAWMILGRKTERVWRVQISGDWENRAPSCKSLSWKFSNIEDSPSQLTTGSATTHTATTQQYYHVHVHAWISSVAWREAWARFGNQCQAGHCLGMSTEDSCLAADGMGYPRVTGRTLVSSRAGQGMQSFIQLLLLGPARMLCPAVQFQKCLQVKKQRRRGDRAAPYCTVTPRTRLSSSNERRLCRPRFASAGLDPGTRVCVIFCSGPKFQDCLH